MANAGGYTTPTWEELGSAVKVIFHPHTYTMERPIEVPPTEVKDLAPCQQEILSLLQKHEKLTAKEILSKLSPNISERTVRNDLLGLKKQNLVEIMGKGPNSFWKLSHISA